MGGDLGIWGLTRFSWEFSLDIYGFEAIIERFKGFHDVSLLTCRQVSFQVLEAGTVVGPSGPT